jgi:hypothetical protein
MDKARSSLMNLDYGIFPKACDHERISSLVNEKKGTRWRPIRSNDRGSGRQSTEYPSAIKENGTDVVQNSSRMAQK